MTLFALVRSLKRQHASQAAGFAAVTIAAAAFISWWVSLPLLSSWVSGFATLKPTTALSLAALDLLDLFGIDFGIKRLNSLLVPRAAVPGPETSFHMINGVPVALELAGAS